MLSGRFSVKIEGKVIFASSRKIPWVPRVAIGFGGLRGWLEKLCLGDAFVYGSLRQLGGFN